MLRIAGRRVGEERVAARSADDLVGVAGAEHPVVAFAGTKRRVARSLTVGQGDMIAAAERVEGERGERMEKIEVVQVDDIQAFGEAGKRIVALGHNGRSYVDARQTRGLLGSAATTSAEAAQTGEARLGLGCHLVGGAVLVRVVPELAV